MQTLTLQDFRCFHERQTARLAPLTLLVGENSTGKTSFMAMIRALIDYALGSEVPDFKKEPYDLGSFDEIAHHRGGKSGRAASFEAEFDATSSMLTGQRGDERLHRFEVTFKNKDTTPAPVRRRLACGDIWLDEMFETGAPHILRVGTSRGSWERRLPTEISDRLGGQPIQLPISFYLLTVLEQGDDRAGRCARPGSQTAGWRSKF